MVKTPPLDFLTPAAGELVSVFVQRAQGKSNSPGDFDTAVFVFVFRFNLEHRGSAFRYKQ